MNTKKATQKPLPTENGWGGASLSTTNFILQHRNDDVRTLALKTVSDATIDLKTALEQIAGWQKARTKLPMWAETDGIIYPPHISMEQCSSQQTAQYKAKLARRLANNGATAAQDMLVDLTGGFGVDFSYMVSGFSRGVYVEQNERLCEIAKHNFGVLALPPVEVKNTSAERFLDELGEASLIFIDPARRDTAGNRTYAISDCTPDVLAMKDRLLSHAPVVIVKLSPMLDWRKAVSDFHGAVSEVHIVACGNECKELLLVLERETTKSVKVFCVNDDDTLEFNYDALGVIDDPCEAQQTHDHESNGGSQYLCEPNVAVMKAGCFNLIERRFCVERVGVNSNLFVSDNMPTAFPGRVFIVEATSTMNRRELKQLLSGVSRANITTRNFPLSVQELRKRLKLKDGGDCYLFATTDHAGRHLIIKCKKP